MPPRKKKNTSDVGSFVITSDDFNHMSQREHTLARPEIYMGEIAIQNITSWLLDANLKLSKQLISQSRSLFHIFSEMITNASDNVALSRAAKYPIGEIKVDVEGTRVTIENNGMPIPIEIKDGVYLPEMIFAKFRTGVNFGDIYGNEKTKIKKGAGKNGLGAKIANVYSLFFSIECYDTIRKKSYKQIWRNNMADKEEAIIGDYTGNKDIVKVTYDLEFSRFGYPLDYQYTEENIDVLRFIACNNAMSQRVPIVFNGIVLPHTIEAFAEIWQNLHAEKSEEEFIGLEKEEEKKEEGEEKEEEKKEEGEKEGEEKEEGEKEEGEGGEEKEEEKKEIRKRIYHIEWPEGTIFIGRGKNARLKNPDTLPDVELYLFDKERGIPGLTFSTASGAITYEGGVHEQAVWNELAKVLDGKIKNVTLKYIRDQLPKHLGMILIYRPENPLFRDQAKTYLTNPKPIIIFSQDERKQLQEWFIIKYIEELILLQAEMNAKKSDGKRKKMVTVRNLVDAGYAATKNSKDAILCYCEGKSASAYPKKLRDYSENGCKRYGYIFGKGKPLNIENFSVQKLAANEGYQAIKYALGLEEKVDYSKIDNRLKLRYGEFLIMTDSDKDGFHISGLIFLMLYKRFPSLFQTDFVKIWCTPILRVTKGNKVVKFFTENEYEIWKGENQDYDTWDHKYLKGLATSGNKEVKDDIKDPHKIVVVSDEYTEDYLKLLYTKGYEDLRKKWIASYRPNDFNLRNKKKITISEFISFQHILFSKYDVERSLPHRVDGLKLSTRKCVEGSFRIWGENASKDKQKAIKIDKLGNDITKKVTYHHGVNSLYGAIKNMAQDYPGSNNLPYYMQESQVGTRDMAGADGGAERYVEVSLNPVIRRSLIRKEDELILTKIWEENLQCEPICFEPVLPPLLINGSDGIGTGSMCAWKSHNPKDIANNLILFIDDKEMKPMIPWMMDYTGEVFVKDINVKEKPLKADLNLKFDKLTKSPINKAKVVDHVEIHGIVTGDTKKAIITEIPTVYSISQYRVYLQELVEDKVIKRFEDNSSSEKVHFEIFGHVSPIKENLQLIDKTTMSNLVALDDFGRPIRYANTLEYLEWWCTRRLEKYEERKVKMIDYKQKSIDALEIKIRFLNAVISGKLKFENRTDDQIDNDMKKLGFDPQIASNVNLRQLTKTKMESLIKLKDNETKSLADYKKIPAKEIWRREIQEFLEDYGKWIKKRENDKN